MARAISLTRTHFRSLTQTLISPFSLLSSSYSLSLKHQNNNKGKDDSNDVVTLFNRDPDDPPRLFLVQPRLRPPKFLQAKLNEALCLANSLEEQRDGYFDTDFFDKELPPHVVVQNPSLKLGKARAGMLVFGLIFFRGLVLIPRCLILRISTMFLEYTFSVFYVRYCCDINPLS